MTTVNFVCPHRRRISAPGAIGRKVGDDIGEGPSVIRPGKGDVLFGHPHGGTGPRLLQQRGAASAGDVMPYVQGRAKRLRE